MGLTFNMTLNRAFECFNVVSSAIYLTQQGSIFLNIFGLEMVSSTLKTFAMITMAAIKKTFGLKNIIRRAAVALFNPGIFSSYIMLV